MGWKTNIPSSEVVLYTTRQAEKAGHRGNPGVGQECFCLEHVERMEPNSTGTCMGTA